MLEKKVPKRQVRSGIKYNRLSALLVCLLLTVIVTVFSIWYNLNNFSASSPDLFGFIGERLETGFQESNSISNR